MRTLLLLFTLMLVFISTGYCTNIGFSHNAIAGETGWGLHLDTEVDLSDNINLEIDVNGQNTGTIYLGNFDAQLGFPIGSFEVAVDSETKFIGYTLDSLGHDTSIGLKATANIGNFGIVVGIYGANAGEFGSRNAADILTEDNGFLPNQIEGLGLESLTAPSNTLSIKDGSRVNARIGLETSIFDGHADLHISARPEIGASENPVHQLITGISTGIPLSENAKIILQGEYGIQTWFEDIESEWSSNLTFNLKL